MSDKVEDEHLEGQMSIIEHLTELRNRIGVVFICFIVMFFISVVRPFGEGSQSIADIVYTFLQAPLADVLLERGGRMIFTGLHEGFFTQIKVGFFTALCVTFPIMLAQIWKFVAPALYKNEKGAFPTFLDCNTLTFHTWRRNGLLSCDTISMAIFYLF